MITFSTSSCPGAGGSVHWCVHHLRAAGRGSGGVGVGGSFPPQQVLGVPQGVYGRIVGWLVKGGVVFDAPEVAHALCNFHFSPITF